MSISAEWEAIAECWGFDNSGSMTEMVVVVVFTIEWEAISKSFSEISLDASFNAWSEIFTPVFHVL